MSERSGFQKVPSMISTLAGAGRGVATNIYRFVPLLFIVFQEPNKRYYVIKKIFWKAIHLIFHNLISL
jgi:hypothetical protein